MLCSWTKLLKSKPRFLDQERTSENIKPNALFLFSNDENQDQKGDLAFKSSHNNLSTVRQPVIDLRLPHSMALSRGLQVMTQTSSTKRVLGWGSGIHGSPEEGGTFLGDWKEVRSSLTC